MKNYSDEIQKRERDSLLSDISTDIQWDSPREIPDQKLYHMANQELQSFERAYAGLSYRELSDIYQELPSGQRFNQQVLQEEIKLGKRSVEQGFGISF